MPTTEELVSPRMRRATRKADDAAEHGFATLRSVLIQTDMERQGLMLSSQRDGALLEQLTDLVEDALFELSEDSPARPKLVERARQLFDAVEGR